jgi:hypothetical protein
MFDEYIGIDLHQGFFQACAVRGDGTRIWDGRYPNDEDGVAVLLTRCAGARCGCASR